MCASVFVGRPGFQILRHPCLINNSHGRFLCGCAAALVLLLAVCFGPASFEPPRRGAPFAALRRDELCKLKTSDVIQTRGNWYFRVWGLTIIGTGSYVKSRQMLGNFFEINASK